MTLEKILKEKEILQSKIDTAVKEFKKKTKLKVDSIDRLDVCWVGDSEVGQKFTVNIKI